MLELRVTVLRKSGHLCGVVSTERARGPTIAVGRFSIAGDKQSYQFNVKRTLDRAEIVSR